MGWSIAKFIQYVCVRLVVCAFVIIMVYPLVWRLLRP